MSYAPGFVHSVAFSPETMHLNPSRANAFKTLIARHQDMGGSGLALFFAVWWL
ncbi:hypothetical protein M378DRAFT_172857 [Amanita muscaria Koide BX008]|uniref:Uncharacterized protein n=1 Tax=Amanita muscaria (strain Koide BX008) TaxID=946122 RepID=A0A0C2SQC3_AMAMK|nr:hypothetical protein M378DRAFT_172857 [Amanita muscaria Koide BX008]